MAYYGSFVLQCYVLRMRVMTSTVGGNLANRPPALRHIHVKTDDLYTIILKIYYTLCTVKLKICTQRFYYSSSKFAKFIQGTVSLLFFSSWPLSLC